MKFNLYSTNRLARCLHELKRYEEAKSCLEIFKSKFTEHAESHAFKALERDIEVACKKNATEKCRKSFRSEYASMSRLSNTLSLASHFCSS